MTTDSQRTAPAPAAEKKAAPLPVYWTYIVGGFALVFGMLLSRFAGTGVCFSRFPFITNDGFDWIYQGFVMVSRLQGVPPPALRVLRDPGFVTVTSLDAWLGAEGLIIVLVNTLAFFFTTMLLLRLARHHRASTTVIAALAIICLLSPLNYFRLFVLSESIAIALMCASAYLMIRYQTRGRLGDLGGAALLALVGSATQTYAAIPFFIGVGLSCLTEWSSRRRAVGPVLIGAGTAIGLVGIKWAWAANIPHVMKPLSFSLLKLSFEMWDFYGAVWSYTLLPLLPFLIVAVLAWRARGYPHRLAIATLAATVTIFMGLSFCYQWRESRFTFLYFPLILMWIAMLAGRETAAQTGWTRRLLPAGALCSALLVIGQLGYTPADHWNMSHRAWRPQRSWIAQAWYALPSDRLSLAGITPTSLDDVTIPAHLDGYAGGIFADYVNFRWGKGSRLARPDEITTIAWADLNVTPTVDYCGMLESITPTPRGRMRFEGWAADAGNGAARCIRVYLDQQPLAIGLVGTPRPDVDAALGFQEARAGFSIKLKIDRAIDLGALSVIAEFKDGTFRLLPIAPTALNQETP